jgi:hypothetical protein
MSNFQIANDSFSSFQRTQFSSGNAEDTPSTSGIENKTHLCSGVIFGLKTPAETD